MDGPASWKPLRVLLRDIFTSRIVSCVGSEGLFFASTQGGGLERVMNLVSHTCCDSNRATQCRAHTVAADSHNFRDVAGMSRYTTPKDGVAPVFPPACRGERRDVVLEGGGGTLEVPEVSRAN